VFFRYTLEDAETSWHEAGTRRQAFYNHLGPGKYRFRVVACNNDGVWNETGASFDFSVEAAYYQTGWFAGLCLLSGAAVLSLLYRLRMRQLAAAMNARFDERLAERTRLAREFHDTLLQTIQGGKIVADDALRHKSDTVRMENAMERLSEWLGQAIQEGRAALSSLPSKGTNSLRPSNAPAKSAPSSVPSSSQLQ
jgi:signal transduction histidine kinase